MGLGFDDLLGIPTGGLYNVGKFAAGGYQSSGNPIEDFFNNGRNRFDPGQGTKQEPTYYGGYEGGAADQAAIGQQGMGASNANASYAAGQMQNDMRGPQAYENQVLSDRESASRYGDQSGAIQLAREAAMGQGPSQAAYQLQQGLDRASNQQRSMQASARGAAGIAQAQSAGAGQIAGLQGQAFTEAGRLRAQEMNQAMNLYGGLSGQQREQDLQRLGQGNQMAQFNAGLNDQYRLGMGQLGVGYSNSGANWYGQSQNPYQSQAQLDYGRNAGNQQSGDNAMMARAGISQANSDLNRRNMESVIGMGGTILNTGASMGAKKPPTA